MFGLYWLIKSRELAKTDADEMRRNRRLERGAYRRASFVRRIPIHAVVRTEADSRAPSRAVGSEEADAPDLALD